MKLIEPEEMEDFHGVWRDSTSPRRTSIWWKPTPRTRRGDEIFGLAGFVTITRKSTGKQNEYPIGDGSTWVAQFQRDVLGKIFD